MTTSAFSPRHRPERLDGVHPTAVRLEDDDLPVGAGDRRAEGRGQAAADCTAVDGVEEVVRSGPLVAARMGGPFVAPSSTRIECSGKSEQSDCPIAAAVRSPEGGAASVRG